MKKSLIAFGLFLVSCPAFAQQQTDLAKVAPYYQQQRNSAFDVIAACAVSTADLQAKIAELERKLAQKEAQ